MVKRAMCGFIAVAVLISVLFLSVFKSEIFGVATSADNKGNFPTVIIDAGHGGFDGGAVAMDGTVEKNLNLQIAQKLDAVLRALGYNTIMVRNEDKAVNDPNDRGVSAKVSDIKNRVELMKKHPKAIFVSIHMNKYQTTQPHGAQVFYSKQNTSDLLAGAIQGSVAEYVQTDNKRVIKPTTKDIYLLYHATVPSVIVECGFLSNNDDLKNLKKPEYQLKMAFSIANGIIKYYKEV